MVQHGYLNMLGKAECIRSFVQEVQQLVDISSIFTTNFIVRNNPKFI